MYNRSVDILLQVLLNVFKNPGSGSDRNLAVGGREWRFQSMNLRPNCHFAHVLPYSPKNPPICSIQKVQHFAPYSSDIQSIQVSPNTTTSTNTQFHKLAATLHHPTLCYIQQRHTRIQISPNTMTSTNTQFHKLAATLHYRRTPKTLPASVTPLHQALARALHLFWHDRSIVPQGTRSLAKNLLYDIASDLFPFQYTNRRQYSIVAVALEYT
jgi:hypothetical protein